MGWITYKVYYNTSYEHFNHTFSGLYRIWSFFSLYAILVYNDLFAMKMLSSCEQLSSYDNVTGDLDDHRSKVE